ncbi:PREDICTED: uncharacterized protein LOC104802769 [Tarenaya hassleriana]|uniref:uncharacterized protein LOC104802769 n=1 Tax=Tarenaya hassleriana TaxID=28532 RepID=UPI00053C2D98|nr:PREDICTED: uncharacterized protein LOC104802769 [Tarenaya hassleriana]
MPGSLEEVSVNEDDNDNDKKKKKKKKKKRSRKGYGCNDVKSEEGDELVMPSSSKPRKRLSFKIRRKPISPKVCISSSSLSGLWKGCGFCGMKPPETKESPSPISDPNDENFTHEMMRALLETDDFCSKECNPHV